MIQEFRCSSAITVSLATQGKQSFRRNTSAWAYTLGGSERNGNEDGVTTLWHGSQRGKMWLMQPSAARSIQSIDVIRCCTINKKKYQSLSFGSSRALLASSTRIFCSEDAAFPDGTSVGTSITVFLSIIHEHKQQRVLVGTISIFDYYEL